MKKSLFLVICLALAPAVLRAQFTLQEDYVAPIVKEIVVQTVGAPALTRDRVLANLSIKEGQPYSESNSEADVRALYATGGVSNVRIFAEPISDNAVKVIVLIQGRPVVEEILVLGANRIPESRVRKEISSKVGEPLSEERLAADRQKILELYRDRNFSDIDVRYSIENNPKENRARVTFTIQEGNRLVVRDIVFVGNNNVKDSVLRDAMKTKRWNLLSVFNRSGRMEPGQLDEDRAAIRAAMRDQGFADATVNAITIEPMSNNGVRLVIEVVEGPRYHVRDLKFTGVHIVAPAEIGSKLASRSEAVFSTSTLADDIKFIRDFYGSRGYVDTTIIPHIIPAGTAKVDIVFNITEGLQSYVNLVNIQGNTRTKDRVIRREFPLAPGDLLDTTQMDVGRRRLEGLNYFSSVNTMPSDTIIPGRKDVNVIVEEKKTGSFNFGVGFSTIDSLVGFAELTQSNFDLLNFPRFTGGGQRFRARVQYGIERSDFMLSFTEPWLFDQPLAFTTEAFYREADYLSDVYKQTNYGVAFQLRRNLWKALTGTAEYRLENVRIHGVDRHKTGIVIREAEGTYTRSNIEGTLMWDTRDDLFLTRRGEVFSASANLAGLGGDVKYYGLSLDAAKYVPLPFDMIFSTRGQLAFTKGTGGDKNYYGEGVPIFDRLYLGGANNMRGFNYREVGPKDEYGNPIGGNSLGFATAELTAPVIPRVRLAIFGDVGFVNSKSFDVKTSDYAANIGIGVRLDLPIGPVRLDYGYPIQHDRFTGPPGKFNFNIGYQFF